MDSGSAEFKMVDQGSGGAREGCGKKSDGWWEERDREGCASTGEDAGGTSCELDR